MQRRRHGDLDANNGDDAGDVVVMDSISALTTPQEPSESAPLMNASSLMSGVFSRNRRMSGRNHPGSGVAKRKIFFWAAMVIAGVILMLIVNHGVQRETPIMSILDSMESVPNGGLGRPGSDTENTLKSIEDKEETNAVNSFEFQNENGDAAKTFEDVESNDASENLEITQDPEDIRRRCPAGSKVELYYPHLNKGGGRTVDATFFDLDDIGKDPRYRHVSAEPRSKTHKFSMYSYHRTYPALARAKHCLPVAQGLARSCEKTTPELCVRWIYTLREPISRVLSAFYTMTGRKGNTVSGRRPVQKRSAILGGTGAQGDSHFFCRPGSAASQAMQQVDFTIEDWVRLPDDERQNCDLAFNIMTKYLAPTTKNSSREQLALAKKRLEDMAWFGILEQWTESLQLFSYVLGTDLVHYVPTFNLNEYDKNLSPHAKAVLEKHNNLDIELYKYAEELFRSRVAKMRLNQRDPFYKPFSFVCDEEKICWNKNSTEKAWPLTNDPLAHFKSEGEAKEMQLCSPKQGCWRTDVRAPFQKNETEVETKAQKNMKGASLATKLKLPFKVRTALQSLETCLPSVFILGARKGGTTSLYEYISAHPRFYGVLLDKKSQSGELLYAHLLDLKRTMSSKTFRKKYNHRFAEELQVSFGSQEGDDSNWMDDIIRGAARTGESTVAYGPACQLPAQIAAACGVNPRIKFIYLVRNPIERIISNYKMRDRLQKAVKGFTIQESIRHDLTSIREAIPTDPQWWTKEDSEGNIPCLYEQDYFNGVWSGMYIVHLTRWMKHYPASQILVLKSEDFLADPAATLRKSLIFIGLDPSVMDVESTVARNYNAAPESAASRSPIPDELRADLQSFYIPYNEALQTTFGIDVSNWN
mmetsp:Transcript_16548/g.32082  ORF Transcript_16548/g.32082 Transcript_16548/m.32082 type:complete len:871 (+) Transcript_16548:92-2704(+)